MPSASSTPARLRGLCGLHGPRAGRPERKGWEGGGPATLTWRAAPHGTSGCVPPSAWRQTGQEPGQNVTAPLKVTRHPPRAAPLPPCASRHFRRTEGRGLFWPRPHPSRLRRGSDWDKWRQFFTQNTAYFGVLLSVLNLSRALEKREPLNKGNGKDKSHSIGVQLKRSPAADPFPCSQCSTDLAWDFHCFYYLTCRQ